jgi:hypothetical protein
MSYFNNKNKVVIPIENTTINGPIYVPEKEHNKIWPFLCIISTIIASIFCCITAL